MYFHFHDFVFPFWWFCISNVFKLNFCWRVVTALLRLASQSTLFRSESYYKWKYRYNYKHHTFIDLGIPNLYFTCINTFQHYFISNLLISNCFNHYLESPESLGVEMIWLFLRIFSYFLQSFREFDIFVQVLGTSYFWQVSRIKLLLN